LLELPRGAQLHRWASLERSSHASSQTV
jgi:hypothetical protein